MTIRRSLLYAGYVGPVAYLLQDIVGGLMSPTAYSFIKNSVSDLTNSAARGEYPLGVVLLLVSALMGALFGAGIVLNFPIIRAKKLSYAGLIILVTGLMQTLTATAFPQDPMGTQSTFPGIMHLVIVGLSAALAIVLLLLVAKWALRENNWHVFGGFTLLTLTLLIGGGIVTAVVAAKQLAILGLVERVSVYPFQLWTIALAYRLIRESENESWASSNRRIQ